MSEELLARVALSRLVEPGTWSVWDAVQREGAAAVREALTAGRRVGTVSARLAAGAAHRAQRYDPRRDLDAVERAAARVLLPVDDGWPADRLHWGGELRDAPPLLLYVRGPAAMAALERSVAVVGARAATPYGLHVALQLGLDLAGSGTAVVSGGAAGVDGAAHRGALRAAAGAPTVAVLAGGVDVVYPRSNDLLLRAVGERGLLLSEAPPGAAPTRSRFLVRNRLIAALTRGTVVVEAGARSGSLSTAARAAALGRPVGAVPGPVTSGQSVGCHELVRAGAAVLVRGVADVRELVAPVGEDAVAPAPVPPGPRDDLADDARRVLDAVPVRCGAGVASVARAAGVPVQLAQQVLPLLQVHGLVARTDDGWVLTPLALGR